MDKSISKEIVKLIKMVIKSNKKQDEFLV